MCPCTLQWAATLTHKKPLPLGDLHSHLIHGSFGPPESQPQTASRSVQTFLQGARTWPTDRQTDRPRYFACSNRPLSLANAVMRPKMKISRLLFVILQIILWTIKRFSDFSVCWIRWLTPFSICLHVNRKAHLAYNFNCLFEPKDFSSSQAVTYTVNVVETVQYKSRCNYIPLTGSDTWPTDWRKLWWPWVTLKVIHLLQAFKCDFSAAVQLCWQDFNSHIARRAVPLQ